MQINLNTDNATAAVRRHFGIDGMTKSEVSQYRSGVISKIEINGVVSERGMPYFDHLVCMVMEAKSEEELDENTAMCIGQLRALS